MSGIVMMCRHAVGKSTATSMPSISIASSCDLALKFCLRAKSITSPRVLFRLPLIMRTSWAKVGLFWRGSLPSTISRFKSPRVGTRTGRGARSLKRGSMYFSQRSSGSMICMSESMILNPFFIGLSHFKITPFRLFPTTTSAEALSTITLT